MGSVYHRSAVYCRTCKSRLSTTATQTACRSTGHDVHVRQSKIWTIQYQDASGLNQTESSKTSDKKKAQHTLRLREGAVARRERIDPGYSEGWRLRVRESLEHYCRQ